jgi:hypothetical protein
MDRNKMTRPGHKMRRFLELEFSYSRLSSIAA